VGRTVGIDDLRFTIDDFPQWVSQSSIVNRQSDGGVVCGEMLNLPFTLHFLLASIVNRQSSIVNRQLDGGGDELPERPFAPG
jgi:hypothetical protein